MFKKLKYVLVMLTSLPLLGCPTMQPKYLLKPEIIKAEGSYAHTASGMTFPLRIGNFQRVTVLRYDVEGLDMSAEYYLFTLSGAVDATVYVYPSPAIVSICSPPEAVELARDRLSQTEFEAVKQVILRCRDAAKLIQEGEVSLLRGRVVYSGKMATFEFENAFAQTLKSYLYLFCYVGGKWTVKFRFTYPKNFDGSKEMEGFMQNLPWTLTGS